jgi:hypothetical protein
MSVVLRVFKVTEADTCLCQPALWLKRVIIPKFFGGLTYLKPKGRLWGACLLLSYVCLLLCKRESALQEAFGMTQTTFPLVFQPQSLVQRPMGYQRSRGLGREFSWNNASWTQEGRTTQVELRIARNYKDKFR